MYRHSCHQLAGILLVWFAVALSTASGQTLLDLPGPTASPILDVTQETPLGRVRPGGDITAALQWALDNLHFHKRQIFLPGGEWKLSKTIRTPFRSGLTLIGSGSGGTDDKRFEGAVTRLKWAGEPGGVMLDVQSASATIGNFTLDGTGKETGILVNKPKKDGVGVGTLRFLPIVATRLATVVQCGGAPGEHNCDNLIFDWLIANGCGRAYHGVNLQGMDIVFRYLNTMNTPVGIEMDGGGFVWVQSCVWIHAGTLLKINNTGGQRVGKYNGYFRVSNVQVDNAAQDGFCLVDCAEPYPIRILADGGLYSYDQAKGTFARLSGRNHLEIRDWTATLQTIEGVAEKGSRPTVMLRGSRLWRPVDDIFTGAINARVRDCVSPSGQWIDWDSEPPQ